MQSPKYPSKPHFYVGGAKWWGKQAAPARLFMHTENLEITLLRSHSQKARPNVSPAYLYQRGNVYYFRYAFPDYLKERFKRRELRLSLCTGFLRTAKKIAAKLRWRLEEILMEQDTMNYGEVRTRLAAELTALLESCGEKRLLTLDEIRRRIDSLRQRMLDAADNNFYSPPKGVLFDSGTHTAVSSSQALEQHYQIFYKNMVNKPEYLTIEAHPEALLEMLHHRIFTTEELAEENLKHILNEYIKMQITFNRIMVARERGDYGFERQFQSTTPLPPMQPVAPEAPPEILLTDFIAMYVDTKVKDKHWQPHSVSDHVNRLNTLVEILGNKAITAITRDDMRNYRDILSKLPPARKKSAQFRNLSIKDILALKPQTTLSVKTVNVTIEAVASMFEWGIREEYISSNPAKSLQIKDDRQEIDLREPFTEQDIKQVFFSGRYKPSSFKHPAYYWAPLIALYSGMRLEEICQLHCSDIMQDGEIWYFDINKNPSEDGVVRKILKNKNAKRNVPIHPKLIELGLLTYWSKLKDSNSDRLFPELNKTEKSPKYGKQVGKTFTRFIEKLDITGNISFHSLRHSFSDFYKKRNLQNDIFTQVFGHDIAQLAAKQYGSKFSVQQCYDEIISVLKYDGDDIYSEAQGK